MWLWTSSVKLDFIFEYSACRLFKETLETSYGDSGLVSTWCRLRTPELCMVNLASGFEVIRSYNLNRRWDQSDKAWPGARECVGPRNCPVGSPTEESHIHAGITTWGQENNNISYDCFYALPVADEEWGVQNSIWSVKLIDRPWGLDFAEMRE